ncbi:MAG: hypothetical protein H0U65_05290 [Rubrobacter sp.]|nr:hypothetical protein [Rubrobacter sp.]
MDERREKRRSWPAIACAVAAWWGAALVVFLLVGTASGGFSAPLVAAAAAGVSAAAVAGLLNALVAWRAGRVVGRRYEEILVVGGSREEAERLVEELADRLAGGRRRWSLERSAGGRRWGRARLHAPATFLSLGESVTLKAGEGWIHVASESAFALSMLDRGRNHRNVEYAGAALERLAGRPSRPL